MGKGLLRKHRGGVKKSVKGSYRGVNEMRSEFCKEVVGIASGMSMAGEAHGYPSEYCNGRRRVDGIRVGNCYYDRPMVDV